MLYEFELHASQVVPVSGQANVVAKQNTAKMATSLGRTISDMLLASFLFSFGIGIGVHLLLIEALIYSD